MTTPEEREARPDAPPVDPNDPDSPALAAAQAVVNAEFDRLHAERAERAGAGIDAERAAWDANEREAEKEGREPW